MSLIITRLTQVFRKRQTVHRSLFLARPYTTTRTLQALGERLVPALNKIKMMTSSKPLPVVATILSESDKENDLANNLGEPLLHQQKPQQQRPRTKFPKPPPHLVLSSSNNNNLFCTPIMPHPLQSANNLSGHELCKTVYTCDDCCCSSFLTGLPETTRNDSDDITGIIHPAVQEVKDDKEEENQLSTKTKPSKSNSNKSLDQHQQENDDDLENSSSDKSDTQTTSNMNKKVPQTSTAAKTNMKQQSKPRFVTLIDWSSSESDDSLWETPANRTRTTTITSKTVKTKRTTNMHPNQNKNSPPQGQSQDTNKPMANKGKQQQPSQPANLARIARRRRIDSSSDEDYERVHDMGYVSDLELENDLVDRMKQVSVNDYTNKDPSTSETVTRPKLRTFRSFNLSRDDEGSSDTASSKSSPVHKDDMKEDDPLVVVDDESSSYLNSNDDDSYVVILDDDDEPVPMPLPRHKKPKPKATKQTTKPPALSKSKASGPQMGGRTFQQLRENLAAEAFRRFNRDAFEGKLSSVELVWSKKLNTTAGLTRLISLKRGKQVVKMEAKIELATKIIDHTDRLESTLLHEMCHAAAWLIDGVAKPAHGACFKKWSAFAMARVSYNNNNGNDWPGCIH